MKKSVLRYGGFSVLFMVVFFIIDELFLGSLSYSDREITGWIGILISTLFVFFGIKYYRDRHNNGMLTFGQGMKLGLLIVLLPSIAFGIFNVIYVLLKPDFMDKYYQGEIDQIKAKYSAAEAAALIADQEKEKIFFSNPALQFLVMFASVFAVGLIITVISALVLRRSEMRRVQTA